ncbi:EamA-like transporter family protein [Shewanella sp. JBTF-M18]|uniref:EamA-like transporter family protein n=1 Tax=Shewanella insulae TaxID=2681496 RepID=A0A6L7I4P9_9GAMM|nr:DMT family transporter [Shewanella insulae]MXR70341.1 EamA-like transporter family protein [Shewanella insulae]
MLTLILLALLNGVCIGLCRILNGRLGQASDAYYASLWNHGVGFVFLSLLLVLMPSPPVAGLLDAPLYAWLGGVVGAVFVVLNTQVILRLGTTLCSLLVISGQLLSGVLFDLVVKAVNPLQLLGVVVIFAGVLAFRRMEAKSVERQEFKLEQRETKH